MCSSENCLWSDWWGRSRRFCVFVVFTLSRELLCGKRETGLGGKNPNLTVVAAVIFTKIEPVQLEFTKLRSGVFVVCRAGAKTLMYNKCILFKTILQLRSGVSLGVPPPREGTFGAKSHHLQLPAKNQISLIRSFIFGSIVYPRGTKIYLFNSQNIFAQLPAKKHIFLIRSSR